MHKHHRKLRSQGGDDSPANLMFVTPEFHDYIHKHTGEAYANGWLVHSWDNPEFQPCRNYLLGDDGWYEKSIIGWSAPVAGEPSETGAEGEADSTAVSPACPRCKGTGKVPPAPSPANAEKKRHRVTLGIRLPKDADENGIEVLEALLTAARDELKDEMNWKDNCPAYYVLVAVLHDWITGRARH